MNEPKEYLKNILVENLYLQVLFLF